MRGLSERAHLHARNADKIRTVFVTCDELEQLPELTIRRHLGPYFVMRTPGALLHIPESNELDMLQQLLIKNKSIKHLVICQHSLCSKFRLGEQSIRLALPSIKHWLKSIHREDIEVHGWMYESETDWISALDADSEFFVPLTAHTRFCEDNLLIG